MSERDRILEASSPKTDPETLRSYLHDKNIKVRNGLAGYRRSPAKSKMLMVRDKN